MVPPPRINLGILHTVRAFVIYTGGRLCLRRPKLESFVDRTSHTPLIGLFGALLKDWIPLIDDYYYCT